MSRPRYGWWGYVKYMIRRYPSLAARLKDMQTPSVTPNLSGMPCGSGVTDTTAAAALRQLPKDQQREYTAVSAAVESTKKRPDSSERLRLVSLIFWERSHTLEGAALVLHVSPRTARRWHGEFIRLVAREYGLLESPPGEKREE